MFIIHDVSAHLSMAASTLSAFGSASATNRSMSLGSQSCHIAFAGIGVSSESAARRLSFMGGRAARARASSAIDLSIVASEAFSVVMLCSVVQPL